MKTLASCLLPLLLAACASSPKPSQSETGQPEPFVQVGGRASANDIARFLAGRPVRQGAALSQLQQGGNYQAFSKDMLGKWRYRASRRVADQREWESLQLRPLIGSPRTLLYPFGGPDLLHALALFPQASTYVLLGLEPAGGLPDLENGDPFAALDSLPRLAKSMETQLVHGYFITKDMKNDLSNGPLQGVTPLLLSTLALMDATVTSVQPLDAGGKQAVDIRFLLPGSGSKRVVYVSGDVSNGGFDASYRSWLSAWTGATAYFKAASYLMHDDGFSSIRSWVLSNCRSVVQDDSGIPFRYYDRASWDVRLFGNYRAPIALFSKHLQPDLRAAYEAAGPVAPVPFGSGYHLRPADANLTVAIRK